MTAANIAVPDTTQELPRCRELAPILARIGDKWTVLVVGALAGGPLRYNALRRTVEGISQRMLTLTLKGLVEDGLVSRTLYPTIPPRVDYELTPLGRTLIDPLVALFEWARDHRAEIETARAAARTDELAAERAALP